MGKGIYEEVRGGIFFSAREPETRTRVLGSLDSQREKWEGVVQREGAHSPASRGLGFIPGNVRSNFRPAHFTMREGCGERV